MRTKRGADNHSIRIPSSVPRCQVTSQSIRRGAVFYHPGYSSSNQTLSLPLACLLEVTTNFLRGVHIPADFTQQVTSDTDPDLKGSAGKHPNAPWISAREEFKCILTQCSQAPPASTPLSFASRHWTLLTDAKDFCSELPSKPRVIYHYPLSPASSNPQSCRSGVCKEVAQQRCSSERTRQPHTSGSTCFPGYTKPRIGHHGLR